MKVPYCKVREALAWRALNDMTSVWESTLPRHIKLASSKQPWSTRYGCESWTLKPILQKSLEGCYTRMLRVILNIDQNKHVTKKHLYGGLPRLCDKVASRRMKLAGHC